MPEVLTLVRWKFDLWLLFACYSNCCLSHKRLQVNSIPVVVGVVVNHQPASRWNFDQLMLLLGNRFDLRLELQANLQNRILLQGSTECRTLNFEKRLLASQRRQLPCSCRLIELENQAYTMQKGNTHLELKNWANNIVSRVQLSSCQKNEVSVLHCSKLGSRLSS